MLTIFTGELEAVDPRPGVPQGSHVHVVAVAAEREAAAGVQEPAVDLHVISVSAAAASSPPRGLVR